MWNVLKEKSAGQIRVESSQTRIKHTFLDYIRGGLNLSLVTCIDFTGSNGDPSSHQSLHHRSDATINQYEQAIMEVCSVLLNYDYDQQIQTFGFGAIPKFQNAQGQPFYGKTSHFFPCSGDMTNTSGNGVKGVYGLYNNALNNVDLSGPTYFAPLLEKVVGFTKQSVQSNPDNYTVLLILTDGVIHDMSETIEWVIEAANLPMSVIIIGVGNENFKQMEVLDGDSRNLTSDTGRRAARDIVQFVPFREYCNPARKGELASKVLKELPDQVTGYFEMIGKKPNPAIKPSLSKTYF